MRPLLALALVLVLSMAVPPAAAQVPPDGELWRAVAEHLEIGSRVEIALRDGRRVTATLLAAGADGLTILPRTRARVPPQHVDYAAIVSLERDEARGIGAGKAVALGIASGVGAFLATLLIVVAVAD